MWAYGREVEFPNATSSPIGRIGYFTSRDGFHWLPHKGKGPLGSIFNANSRCPDCFDSKEVGVGDVKYLNGNFYMWYTGVSSKITTSLPTYAAGVAVSRDGVNWSRCKGPDKSGAFLSPSSTDLLVLVFSLSDAAAPYPSAYQQLSTTVNYKQQDVDCSELQRSWNKTQMKGRFKLFYNSIASITAPRILPYAAVGDSIFKFKKTGVIKALLPGNKTATPAAWDTQGTGCASVLRVGQKEWLMFYEGDANATANIGLARSKDGITFVKDVSCTGVPGGPVLRTGSGNAWDNGAIGTPFPLLQPNGSIFLYYVGFSKTKATNATGEAGYAAQIGMAVGHRNNPCRFRKVLLTD